MNTRRFTADMLNDPFFIGFDSLLNKLNHPINTSTNYPPYNLIKTGENTFLIELAVAGFSEEDFVIELQNGILTIKGEVGAADLSTNYIHKGIAARSFERKFTLADTVKVSGASLHQGMLTIQLTNEIPEEKKPIRIPVNSEKQLLVENV